MKTTARAIPVLATAAVCAWLLHAQASGPAVIHIDAAKAARHVSPKLYGLMTEEINFSYDGGIYGELVRNRSFKEDAKEPVHWELVQPASASGSMALDPSQPLNKAIGVSLKLTATSGTVGAANEGFWGIPVRPDTRYRASFYAKAAPGYAGPMAVAITSADGATVIARAQIPHITADWKKYEAVLTAGKDVKPSISNRFVISTGGPGTVWIGMASLFPPTFDNRPNGNRPDIMQLLADMHPAFLRLPGGNYLEGNTIATRFEWKTTIGDIAQRPGHMNDAWRYWSSDGMGLLEFLEWCEDLHMEPLLAVYAGYSLHGERIETGAPLKPYVDDALDEIEYLTGDAGKTTWGVRRAQDGHPKPFPLTYVEVGNEDAFDRRDGGTYDARFAQFFDAIKAKYPQLQVIATTPVKSRTPDLIDEHYYRNSDDEMASHAHDYDSRPRGSGPKVMVGEWATRVGQPTPNMSGALGDAAWMTGMERNSDLVVLSSYAPLFVNVNPGAMQWRSDLIGYDTMTSYGSPSYWAQQLFSTHHGDLILPSTEENIPLKDWQPPQGRAGADGKQPPPRPLQHVPTLFESATRDSKTGMVYLKIVNRASTPQAVKIEIAGLRIDPKGQSIAMAASSPDDTNSVTEPTKIVPKPTAVDGLGATFTRTFPAYSITVLELRGK